MKIKTLLITLFIIISFGLCVYGFCWVMARYPTYTITTMFAIAGIVMMVWLYKVVDYVIDKD